MSNGKRWAYLGASVGGVVSVAANVAHSFVPPDGAPSSWQPHGGAIVLAAFWPLALLLAVEVLARVSWPDQLRWALIRWCGVTPVAAVAAIVSYRHLSGLLGFYGEDGVTVTLGPLAVDGLMVISTGALLALVGRVNAPVQELEVAREDQEVVTQIIDPEPPVTQEVVQELTPDPLTQAQAVPDLVQPDQPTLTLVGDEKVLARAEQVAWAAKRIEEGRKPTDIQRLGARKFGISEPTMKRRYTEAKTKAQRVSA